MARDSILRQLGLFGVVLILAKLIYLWLEGRYNLDLLELVGQAGYTLPNAQQIERTGHRLAAVGAALLVVGLAHPWLRKCWRNWAGAFFGLAGLSILMIYIVLAVGSYRGMVHAQYALIDHLVETASPEKTYEAYYLSALRTLYVNGHILHSQWMPVARDAQGRPLLEPQHKVVLALLPALVGNRDAVVGMLQDRGQEGFAEYARAMAAASRFDGDWQAYRQAHDELEFAWQHYSRGMTQAQYRADQEARNLERSWVFGMRSLVEGWQEYQEGVRRWRSSSNGYDAYMGRDRVDRLYRRLVAYFNDPTDEKYDHAVKYAVPGNPQPSDWCDAGQCPGSWSYVRGMLRYQVGDFFARRHGQGYSPYLSWREFVLHPNTQVQMNQARPREMPRSISMFEYREVHDWTMSHIEERAREALRGVVAELGPDVPVPAPGMNAEEFVRSETVQHIMRERTGEVVPLGLDKQAFFEQVWAPRVGTPDCAEAG
jgi:hypothetical protein